MENHSTTSEQEASSSFVDIRFLNVGPDLETKAFFDEVDGLLSPLGIRVHPTYGMALSAKSPIVTTLHIVANTTVTILDKFACAASELSDVIRLFSQRMQDRHDPWYGPHITVEMNRVEHALYAEGRKEMEHLISSLRLLPSYWRAWGHVIPMLVEPGTMYRIDWCLREGHWFPVSGVSRTPHTNENFREHWPEIVRVRAILQGVDVGSNSNPTHQKSSVKAFLAYAPEDEGFCDELSKHLRPLERDGLVEQWHNKKIAPGEDVQLVATHYIDSAKLILLLISVDFISSDYFYDVELRRALERHETKKAVAVPVILRPCDWRQGALGRLLPLPQDGKPVTRWENKDDAFLSVVTGIRELLGNQAHVSR
jgi:TIR domain